MFLERLWTAYGRAKLFESINSNGIRCIAVLHNRILQQFELSTLSISTNKGTRNVPIHQPEVGENDKLCNLTTLHFAMQQHTRKQKSNLNSPSSLWPNIVSSCFISDLSDCYSPHIWDSQKNYGEIFIYRMGCFMTLLLICIKTSVNFGFAGAIVKVVWRSKTIHLMDDNKKCNKNSLNFLVFPFIEIKYTLYKMV